MHAGRDDANVQPLRKKYFASRFARHSITDSSRPASLSKRGVSRSSRTWVRDAVAACGAKTNAHSQRTAKSCGPDAPTLASSWPQCSRIALAMVTTSPVHQGEHEISRKTIAQGRPDRSGEPVVDLLVCFSFLHTRLRVHQTPGFPCALHFGVADLCARLGRIVSREARIRGSHQARLALTIVDRREPVRTLCDVARLS